MDIWGNEITKEQFCEETFTNPEGWLFENLAEDDEPKYYVDDDGIYYFDDGKGNVRRFKLMPEYNEVQQSKLLFKGQNQEPHWGMYSMWGYIK